MRMWCLCDNPLVSRLLGTVARRGARQSTNGRGWRSSPQQSASLTWLRSVCTTLRITGDYCCWPPRQATAARWANWPKGQRRTDGPTWPSSRTSCRGSGCLTSGSRVITRGGLKLLSSPCFLRLFAQIGQMPGAANQNPSLARGCIPGQDVSTQPCVEVKLFVSVYIRYGSVKKKKTKKR